jgi:glycerol-3-phosphate dehydrogenase (NAD(P)+)
MKVTVIGAGGWGTALANLLCQNKNDVILWGHDAARLDELQRTGRNELFLPGIPLDPKLKFQRDLPAAVDGSDCAVLAVPSKFFRETTKGISNFKGVAVSVTKGIEYESGLTMSGVLKITMPGATGAVLSGPTLALEVARGIPAAIVAAHPDAAVAKEVQQLFHRPNFRVYTATTCWVWNWVGR